jgi:hypothetical protein
MSTFKSFLVLEVGRNLLVIIGQHAFLLLERVAVEVLGVEGLKVRPAVAGPVVVVGL